MPGRPGFVEAAFAHAGLDWRPHVALDDRYLRPTEVDDLRGDPSKARRLLNWRPKVGFRDLARMMVDHDIELARRERFLKEGGFQVHSPSRC